MMDKPLNPTSAVLTPARVEDGAWALPRGHAEGGLEAWLADQRWRAALDGSWTVEDYRGGSHRYPPK